MAYTVSIAINLRSDRTGLASVLRAQLYDANGTMSGSPVASGFAELGGGSYQFTHDYADNFRGSVKVYDIGTPSVRLAGFAVNPLPSASGGGVVNANVVSINGEAATADTTTDSRLATLEGRIPAPVALASQIPGSTELQSAVVVGINSISVVDPGPPSAHTTLPKMIAAIWRDLYGKKTKSSTQIKRYAANGTTVNSTQAITDDGSGNESVGAAT